MGALSSPTPSPEDRPDIHLSKGLRNVPSLGPFSLEGLDPGSASYARVIHDAVTSLVAPRRSFCVLDQAACRELERHGLVEWGSVETAAGRLPDVPYFPSDEGRYRTVERLQDRLRLIADYIARGGQNPDQRVLSEIREREPHEVLREVRDRLNKSVGSLSEFRKERTGRTGFGYISLTDLGRRLYKTWERLDNETGRYAARAFCLLSHEVGVSRDAPEARGEMRHEIIAHLIKVRELGIPESDFRKLVFFALRPRELRGDDGKITLASVKIRLAVRLGAVNRAHLIEDYIAAENSESRQGPMEELQAMDGGNYCPIPYPSWNPHKERAIKESFQVVKRGLREGGNFTLLARESRRLTDGSPALLARFGIENFDLAQGVGSSSSDLSPGRGFVFSAARPEKQFFGGRRWQQQFAASQDEWLAGAEQHYESSTFGFLRYFKLVTNPGPEFRVGEIPYSYLVWNSHQIANYSLAWLYPSALLTRALRPCLYDLERGTDPDTGDATQSYLNEPALYKKCVESGMAPLNLSWISTLFGGCCNSFPVGWGTNFQWEIPNRNVLWKDAEGHVHSSYLVWNYQHDRQMVDSSLRPLQALHDEVHQVAFKYQQQLGLFNHRYRAFKADHLPGPKGPPLMLMEAYRYFRSSVPETEKPIICISDGISSSSMEPLLDCATLELRTDDGVVQLPKNGSGGETAELNLWRTHVVSDLIGGKGRDRYETGYELHVMDRSYLNEWRGYV